MIQRFTRLLLLGVIFLSTLSASAYDARIDGIYYDFDTNNKTAKVTYLYAPPPSNKNWFAYHGEVTIPSTVIYRGKKYFVTSIGEGAFSECSSLTSVTIPKSITCIGNSAFENCSSLTSITIPKSVTSIGQRAFYGCSSLTSITIPKSVTSIGQSAFDGCSSLTSITIPKSVTSIGQSAFWCCSALTSVAIPNSVTSIGRSAFSGCSSLTSVTIPNSVTSIGEDAFAGCSSLTSITIPNSVTSIGQYVFRGCYVLTDRFTDNSNIPHLRGGDPLGVTLCDVEQDDGLLIKESYRSGTCTTSVVACRTWATSVTIPNSVTDIEYDAFNGCRDLTSVTIPNSVTSIGNSAFRHCSALTSVTIPNSVTRIGHSAFVFCSALTSVTIPNSVTSIGKGAFWGCYMQTDNFVNNSSCTSSDNWGLTLCDTEQTDGLLIKENSAVRCRPWATSITIPNSVTSIEDGTFYGCSSLTSVTNMADTPQSISNNTFSTYGTLYIPKGAKSAYETADYWMNFTIKEIE